MTQAPTPPAALATDTRIYVAGHRGMVGSALMRRFQAAGYTNLVTRTSSELDLTRQADVADFFAAERPDAVILAAARVGGILANNSRPAEFIYDNLVIQSNVIEQARAHGVQRLLFLGSSCIYPRECPQPMAETHLLTGPLEPTNAPYAVAKIAGITLCEAYNRQYGTDYLAVMPTNLYGPGDNYNLVGSHVLPAMIRKYAEARDAGAEAVTLWGTGTPRREFLHVDDLADACLFLLNRVHTHGQVLAHGCEPSGDGDALPLINVGWGRDLSIAELAAQVQEAVGYVGATRWDRDKPDGTPRKLLDTTRLTGLGWQPSISLGDGIRQTVRDFERERANGAVRN